ncbi:hypothetical protein K2173_007359 [Erythroxylum novogranatense]|uniref:Uncharacterized protein n=1 Tax=Erythroxylum novogranatense TaxID=1862640 RepID=A0AAV8T7P8_9ROSI|nr:hypothetical protein K2173_007359 [Erythroxylum novogranatense]
MRSLEGSKKSFWQLLLSFLKNILSIEHRQLHFEKYISINLFFQETREERTKCCWIPRLGDYFLFLSISYPINVLSSCPFLSSPPWKLFFISFPSTETAFLLVLFA